MLLKHGSISCGRVNVESSESTEKLKMYSYHLYVFEQLVLLCEEQNKRHSFSQTTYVYKGHIPVSIAALSILIGGPSSRNILKWFYSFWVRAATKAYLSIIKKISRILFSVPIFPDFKINFDLFKSNSLNFTLIKNWFWKVNTPKIDFRPVLISFLYFSWF